MGVNKNGEVGIRTRGPSYPGQLLSRQLHSTTLPPLQNLRSLLLSFFLKKLTQKPSALSSQNAPLNTQMVI